MTPVRKRFPALRTTRDHRELFGDRAIDAVCIATPVGTHRRLAEEAFAAVSVGMHASLEFGNRIGSRVRIHTGCFLELVKVEEDMFLGPHVVFTDDPHPQCPASRSARTRSSARAACCASAVFRHARCGPGIPAVQVKGDIADLSCFAGIYPHAYAWLEAQTHREPVLKEESSQ